MSACDCMLGPVESDPRPARTDSIVSEADRERADGLARNRIWADAHAHPGRCFLAGLADDDPFARLMGAARMDEAREDLVAGRVGLVCMATVGDLRVLEIGPSGIRATGHFEPGEAARDHRRQLLAMREAIASPDWQPVVCAADLRAGAPGGPPGAILTCEGGDFLEGRVEGVHEVFELGARSITLVHYRVNELGDIQTEAPVHDGLTAFGADVVREMNRLGMLIDLAHATESVTKDVLDISTAPVMISHSHLAAGADSHPRLLRPEHALSVTRAGGLVAAWPAGVAFECFDDFIDEVLRMVDLLGVGAVAIGTDMDANYRPVVKNYREFPDIAVRLSDRGMNDDEVARVLGGNVVDLFATVLP